MKNQNSKKSKGAFHSNIESMTKKRIESMIILDSDPDRHSIRLLQDASTGFYVVFNGRYNQSHYAKSYQMAERYFNHLVALS